MQTLIAHEFSDLLKESYCSLNIPLSDSVVNERGLWVGIQQDVYVLFSHPLRPCYCRQLSLVENVAIGPYSTDTRRANKYK